jgi:SecD/SecF fusion protein
MSRWVYWVSLLAIVGIIAYPVIKLNTDPQATLSDLFRLGIDLEGGTLMTFELHAGDAGQEAPNAQAAKKVIMGRIDPQGTRGYIVRAVGAHRLEIVLPGRATKVRMTSEAVTNELLAAARQAAARQNNKVAADILQAKGDAFTAGTVLKARLSPPLYLEDVQTRVLEAVRERIPARAGSVAVVGVDGSGEQWQEIEVLTTVSPTDAKTVSEWQKLLTDALAAQRDVTRVKRLVRQAGFLEFRIVADRVKDRDKANFDRIVDLKKAGRPSDSPQWRWYPMKKGWELYTNPRDKGGNLLDAWDYVYYPDPDTQTVEVLVNVADGQDVSGRDMARAMATSQGGDPIIQFSMTSPAAPRFERLTGPERVGRHLGIILDGVIQTAPVLKATLSGGGIIEGYKSQREMEEVVTVLNSGQLAASLGDPVSEWTVGPELGADNIRNGMTASIIGFGLVLVFMAVYYLFAGLVADMAVILNLVLTVCIMYWIRQTWTLPGIAGLILALAMAVDANVLIFERLREEKAKGGSLAFALKKAYGRAFTTIFDSNLTTVIPAFVLLLPGLATEEVKGFALVMIIGIGVSMFTAVVVTRMVFETGIRWGLIKQIKMLHFFEKPNIDWMRFARFAFVITLVLALAGIVLFSTRGDEKYDIEFVGGTRVMLTLQPPAGQTSVSIEEVRNRATGVLGPATTVQEVILPGEVSENPLSHFSITVPAAGSAVTGETAVKDALQEVFRDLQPKGRTQEVKTAASEIDLATLIRRRDAEKPGAPAGAPAAAEPNEGSYIPDDLRKYWHQVRVSVELDPPMTPEEVQRRLETLIHDRYAELSDTSYLVQGVTVAGTPGQFKAFDLWVGVEYESTHAETPSPKFWQDLIVSALRSQEAFSSTTSFEPTMAGEAWSKAVVAILFSLAAMAIYIWFRFAKFSSGIAAVVATLHDVLITLGAVTVGSLIYALWNDNFLHLTDMKVNLPLIGAFLTLVGYSVNDTIVVFDRIRENRGKYGDLSISIINNSINQTLSRTVLTSSTVFLAVVALYFFGGKDSSIHGLAFVMLIGTVVGCYSSIAIASPILVMYDYLKRVYAWSYPILGAALLAYFAAVWMKPAEFFGQWVAVLAAVAALAWIILVTWGAATTAYGRPWTLLGKAPGLVRLMAGLGLLAPVLTVALFVAATVASKASGTSAWAGPGAAAAMLTCPATVMLYRLAWGKAAQQNN